MMILEVDVCEMLYDLLCVHLGEFVLSTDTKAKEEYEVSEISLLPRCMSTQHAHDSIETP